jgi:hypothetical protein
VPHPEVWRKGKPVYPDTRGDGAIPGNATIKATTGNKACLAGWAPSA